MILCVFFVEFIEKWLHTSATLSTYFGVVGEHTSEKTSGWVVGMFSLGYCMAENQTLCTLDGCWILR